MWRAPLPRTSERDVVVVLAPVWVSRDTTLHAPRASSKRASITSAPNTTCARRSCWRAVSRRYARISGCGEYERDQPGSGANEKE